MFSESIQHVLAELIVRFKNLSAEQSSALAVFASCVVLLLTWRIWTFTIIPRLHPYEPKELPYWVPFIGHAMAFFKNSDAVMTYGREYFHNNRQPFVITVAGEKLCIVTSPHDISAIYRNTTTLIFDTFVRDLMVDFGVSSSGVQKMFESPEKVRRGSVERPPVPPPDSIGVHGRSFSKQQLQPGELLNSVQDKIMHFYTDSLRWQALSRAYTIESGPRSKRISLMGWCQQIVLAAGSNAFYGERLLQMAPDLLETYIKFDQHSWMIFYKYPAMFAKPMSVPKEKIVQAFTAFYQLSPEDRLGMAWYLQALESEQRKIGMNDRDIGVTSLTTFNVTSANPFKLCFWMLAYILFDQGLCKSLRTEVTSAFEANKLDVERLINDCPKLQAVFDEVLRLKTASTSIRTVLSPTTINGFHLRVGMKILLPYRQLHVDPNVFGTNVADFDSTRFLRDKTLGKSSSYRPFGGGSTFCPGRFIARSQVTAFVATILNRFDVQLASSTGKRQKFPRMEEGKPSLGVMGPMKGDDLIVDVRPLE